MEMPTEIMPMSALKHLVLTNIYSAQSDVVVNVPMACVAITTFIGFTAV